jgi:Fe-S cluster biogenesis protein NfuA
MGVDGITSIVYGPDFVTVSKDDSQPWSILKPEIFSILMEHFTSGKNLFKDDQAEMDGPQDTKILDTDSEVVAMIKELLDTRVRPAIQEDGGDIEFKGFEDEDGEGIVRLKLKGSCRGCSSSSVTLKSGIERMLTHYIPEVKTVEQVSSSPALNAFPGKFPLQTVWLILEIRFYRMRFLHTGRSWTRKRSSP